MTVSLLEWAARPDQSPYPLPPDEERRLGKREYGLDPRRTAWPIGLLPDAAIAADLSDRGFGYGRGVGYTFEGKTTERMQVARAAATVLDEAAALLGAEEHAAAHWGLVHTARDLRVSRPAQSILVDLVRPYLPEPSEGAAPAAALEFLRGYDALEEVRRSSLARDYAAAGFPGGLSKDRIRALAAERWGEVVTVRGYEVHRPARASRGWIPVDPPLAASVAALVSQYGRNTVLAALHASAAAPPSSLTPDPREVTS